MRRMHSAAVRKKWARFCHVRLRASNQPQPGFVDERGGLERVAGCSRASLLRTARLRSSS